MIERTVNAVGIELATIRYPHPPRAAGAAAPASAAWQPPTASRQVLRAGAHIRHPAFGAGVVVSSDPRHTVVNFDGQGQRKFATEILLGMQTAAPAVAAKPCTPAAKPLPKLQPPAAETAPAPRKQAATIRPAVTCTHCGGSWHPYNAEGPKVCKRCGSRHWREPKKDWRKVAGAKKRKWTPSLEVDTIIREAYDLYRRSNHRHAITAAAQCLAWPTWKVHRRAVALGLAHVKEAPWSPEEVQILRDYEHLTLDWVKKHLARVGFDRTATAINLKIKRLRIRSERDWYSMTKLSHAFGVDPHTLDPWIERGWLKTELRGTARKAQQGGDIRIAWHNDVRDFVFAHPEEVDLAKVEKFWFLELVTEGKISR